MNLAKQGFEAYSESQGNVSKTGGEEYNAPSHSNQGDYQGDYQGGQGGPGGQGGGQGFRPNIDRDEAVNQASQGSNDDSSFFHNALNHAHANAGGGFSGEDESNVTNSHQQAYHPDGNPRTENTSNMSASEMGSAAAMQALKKFTSGGGSSGGGGGGQTQLISLAMSEASKLFESSGGGGGGDKQAVISSAATTVMKLLAQQGGGGGGSGILGMAGSMIGGGNSGGLGPMQMMSLVSRRYVSSCNMASNLALYLGLQVYVI
ncbi:hypothetical protein PILCRDRAFT_757088 [Piloderma croceum F 1598]|nr:hypothetical protein PILCRDRAFT_757088 [Piloderma croceum F 1598]